MIHFNLFEIMVSIFGSVLYGIIISFLFAVFRQIAILPDTLSIIFKKNDFAELIKFEKSPYGSGLTLLMFLVFTLGFVLLSYGVLDGSIRAYALCLSLLFFFLSKRLAFIAIGAVIFCTGKILFFLPAKFWRRKRY